VIPFRNGSRIVFAARERGAIRGFTKVRRLVLDEAQILTESAMADLAPTMNQAENPQIIADGDAAEADGPVGGVHELAGCRWRGRPRVCCGSSSRRSRGRSPMIGCVAGREPVVSGADAGEGDPADAEAADG
jgi:hypothetical protein